MNSIELKQELLQNCQKWAENRLKSAKNAQKGIQESLTNETKSSAGDKHETGRAMLQIERENIGKQLNEIQKTMEIIRRTDIAHPSEKVKLGSLVITDSINYFVCVSAGQFRIENHDYYAVSAQSPIGQLLLGKQRYEELTFNGKQNKIEAIY